MRPVDQYGTCITTALLNRSLPSKAFLTINNPSCANDMTRQDETRPLLARDSTTYETEARSLKHEEVVVLSPIRGSVICVSIFLLIFILTCNVSLITTIQSPIAEELNASSEVAWFTSSLLIAVTSLTPISGKLCQIFTPRLYLLVSIVIQSIGLLWTSQARTLASFLTGRVVTGIGSAAVTPVAFILVTELSSKTRRGLFFGLINTGYTTGVACGAIIAGALEPIVGWRAVFWLQVPFALAAVLAAFLALSKLEFARTDEGQSSLGHKLRRIDFAGVCTLIIAFVMLLYSLSLPKVNYIGIGLASAMLALFVFIEARWATEPIVPLDVMRNRPNIFSGLATVGLMTARWSILFYTPVYAIAVRGWIQSAAGTLLVPTNAGFALGGIVIGVVHIRRTKSFYFSTLTCFVLFAVVQAAISQLVTPQSPIWLLIIILFCNGFIVGALLNYSLAHLLYLTPADQHVIVIPFNATFRSFSGSFGSAIAGGYFLRTLYDELDARLKTLGVEDRTEMVKKLLGSPLLVHKLAGATKEAAIEGYSAALAKMFMASVVLALMMLAVQAGVGWRPQVKNEQDVEER